MTGVTRAPYLSSRLQGFGTTVFAEMSALAVATGSINLGQGFPDQPGPAEVLDVARAAIGTAHDQYPPGPGSRTCAPRSPSTSSASHGLSYDPADEVLVTAGATEALTAALIALLEPGDEVVLFEPMYDSYAAAVAMAGGVLRPVPLRRRRRREGAAAVDLRRGRAARRGHPAGPAAAAQHPAQPDRQGLHRAPSSPLLAEVAHAADLLVLTDEVYEHLVFSGAEHVSLADAARACASARWWSAAAGRPSTPPAGRSAGSAARRRWCRRSAPPSSSSPTSTAGRSSRRSPPGCGCPTRTSGTSPTTSSSTGTCW